MDAETPGSRSQAAVDWPSVKRILVVKLRSIGDTVLATPSLAALRSFCPGAMIDILLEDWVAPVLEGFETADHVISMGADTTDRLRMAVEIRRRRYDIVFNLHGGTTSTFLTRATGARYRVGHAEYQYSFLYTHLLNSAPLLWGRDDLQSAEQQLAIIGSAGVPFLAGDRTHLAVTDAASNAIDTRLKRLGVAEREIVLMHPATLFATKQWSVEKYAAIAEHLDRLGFAVIAVSSENEAATLAALKAQTNTPVQTIADLSLPEITALASRARLFVGNDSGIAHIAAAVDTPVVVIFGSSNRVNWRPFGRSQSEMVFREFACQPCPGYECKVYGDPRCILEIEVDEVRAAIDRILAASGPVS